MRVVLQRVRRASVTVGKQTVGEIDQGILALVGVGQGDVLENAKWLADKTIRLRIFADEAGKMNRSVEDIGGKVLAISQFTLLANCHKGRRPAFTGAAEPKIANELYERYCEFIRSAGIPVQTGIFAADMQVELVNDGPATFVIDR